MFSGHLDEILINLLPPEDFALFRKQDLPHLPSGIVNSFRSKAERALREEISNPTLECLMTDIDLFNAIRIKNRELLCALVLGESVTQNGRYIPKAAEIIYHLCSEFSWNRTVDTHLSRHGRQPDLMAVQTAELLVWSILLSGETLEEYVSGIVECVYEECGRRIITYLDDSSYLESAFRSLDALMLGKSLTSICLLTPQDSSERYLRLKSLLKAADRCIDSGYIDGRNGLSAWERNAAAVADITLLTDVACGGQVRLRDNAEILGKIEIICDAYICSEWFADETGNMRPNVDPGALYRLGAAFDSDRLCALAAHLDRLQEEAIDNGYDISSYIINALWRNSLEREQGRLIEKNTIQNNDLGLFGVRPNGNKGFYAALHNGAALLFVDDVPILVESKDQKCLPCIDGKTASVYDIPSCDVGVIGSKKQLAAFNSASDCMISLDMSKAFANSSVNWQRTLLVTTALETVRILDVFDFCGNRCNFALCFSTPLLPTAAVGAPRIRIGNVYLEWDGNLQADIHQDPNGLYIIRLEHDGVSTGGCYTCTFSRCDQ